MYRRRSFRLRRHHGSRLSLCTAIFTLDAADVDEDRSDLPMLLTFGSFLLGSAQLAGQWLVGSRWRHGWLVLLVTGIGIIYYNVVTHQYGWLPFCVAGVITYLRSWLKWSGGEQDTATPRGAERTGRGGMSVLLSSELPRELVYLRVAPADLNC